MAIKPVSKCTQCGVPVAAGEALCPRCRAPSTASSDFDLGSDALPLELLPVRSSSRAVLMNTLFECWRCSRLVETQTHQGRTAVPRFCPWCGKPVSSILGREIDGYRIDELIAAGSFGLIYLASNVAQPLMKAVVKFLRPEMFYHHPELIKIFVEEARLTEEIGQACWNIVRVSNVREEPWPYFFMEYVRGTTMDEVIETSKTKKLPIEDGMGYLRGIAKALAATHFHGRVHRDLKPLNIMVMTSEEVARPEDKIKLLDFGLAMKIASRRVSMRPSQMFTASETTDEETRDSPIQSAGTPEYMAPEAFDGVNDFAADIYSFGVTAYQLLTGELPWRDSPLGSERLFYWRDAHKKKPPRPIRELRSDIPGWLAKLVMQCLEKDATRRPHGAGDLVEKLRMPVPPWIWSAGAAAVLLVAFLGWLAVTGRQSHEVPRWEVDGRPIDGKELTVWAARPEDLPARKIVGMVQSGKKITKCPSPSRGVHIEILDDDPLHFSVTLEADPSLLTESADPISISGGGSDFVFDGVIRVQRDADLPVVGEPGYLDSKGASQSLKAGLRLRSSTTLQASVTELHFRAAKLLLEPTEGKGPIPGDSPSSSGLPGDPITVTFPLTGLPEGHYRGWVVAEDLAGNHGSSELKKVDFVIDDSVKLVPTQGWKALIAKKHAYYGFKLEVDEKIQAVELLDPAGKRTAVELFVSPKDDPAATDLVKDPAPVQPAHLKPGISYLLSVPLVDATQATTFQIEVTDGAIPPNSFTKQLTCPPQAFLAAKDVSRIRIKLVGENDSRSVKLSEFAPSGNLKLEMENPIFLPSAVVEELAVSTGSADASKGQVQLLYTTFTLPTAGEPNPQPRVSLAASGSAVFKGLNLVPDADNEALLTLYDPLDTAVEITLRLHPDTVPPVHEIKPADGKFRTYYSSGADVQLIVKSTEPLSDVAAASGGAEVKGSPATSDPGCLEYVFDKLSTLLPRDGTYSVKVNAKDRALNSTTDSQEIVIDSGPPEVTLLNAESVKDEKGEVFWKLSGSKCLLTVSDPNGVDGKGAVCRIEYSEGPGAPPTVPLPVEMKPEGGQYSISLEKFPNRCQGLLKPAIKDALGLKNTSVFPFEFLRSERLMARVLWKEMGWVLVDGQFYISETEVSNKLYNNPAFISRGKYRKQELLEKYTRPFYWGDRGEYPQYVRDDETLVPGDDFPVVGVSPAEAKEFADAVFGSAGARLPLRDEWLHAARLENPGGKYPWTDEKSGRDWVNCYQSWNGESSLLHRHYYKGMKKSRDKTLYPYYPVEVGFCPFPEELRKRDKAFTRILHIIGNVAELVKLSDGAYGACGGSFDTRYEQAVLDEKPEPYQDAIGRSPRTGFRLVIPAERAPPEFRRPAKKPGQE